MPVRARPAPGKIPPRDSLHRIFFREIPKPDLLIFWFHDFAKITNANFFRALLFHF
jgi:hypothetical protein